MSIKKIRPMRRKKSIVFDIPFEINTISDLIELCKTGNKYKKVDMNILWKILPQLMEIDELIGMKELKHTLFYQIIYYIQKLYKVGRNQEYLHTVITGTPGSGKCLGREIPVLMYDGSIKMSQDIISGDVVMGDDSSPRNVSNVCRGFGQLFQVNYNSKDFFVANEQHILTLEYKNKIVDISIKDYLKKPEKWKELALGYKSSVSFERQIQLTVDPYILGYTVFALFHYEGYVPCIRINNQDILQYFQSHNIISSIDVYNNVYILDKDYYEDYSEILNRAMFKDYIYSSKQDLQYFLAGILDCIGNFSSGKTQICSITTVDIIIKDIMFILNILGIEYTVDTNTTHLETKQAGYDIISTTLNIDTKYIPSFISKKPCPVIPENQKIYHPINIKELEMDEYFGFELDGNHRFLLGNCIVSHNTSVAKIIGEIYKNLGVLSLAGTFRIAKRDDFVAEYLGQTAIKTKKLLTSCLGGVLFIDEVYSLGPGKSDHDSFSKEAIDTINVFLSEHANEFCCIIAGYEDEIKKNFFSVNPGLERRFQWIHRIDRYSSKELADIFFKIMDDISWNAGFDKNTLCDIISKNQDIFQNAGGDVENLITKCKMTHAKNILNNDNSIKYTVSLEDLECAINMIRPNKLHNDNDGFLSLYM